MSDSENTTAPATSRRRWLKTVGSASVAGVLGGQLAACGGGGGGSGGILPIGTATAAEPPASTPTLPAKALFPGVADRIFLNGAADHPWNTYAKDALASYAQSKTTLAGGSATATAKFAALINADADEVTYVPSTSMGEYLVTKALGLPESGGRVVTDALHFVGSFYMYEQYRLRGVNVITVPMDADYRISLSALDAAISPGTKLVAISHVSLYNGFTHDLKAVCDLAHSRGALVYVDLIQSAGNMPIDVKAAGVDFAACGTYKWLMGDFGFAFLYVRKSLLPQLQRPWYGYRQTRNFAAPILHVYPLDPPGSVPYESVQINSVAGYFMGSFPASAVEAACAASIDWIQSVGPGKIQAYRKPMTDALQNGLRARGFQVVTPTDSNSAIVTFAYLNASQLAPRLAPAKIEITLRANHARISPSVFNDMSDIDKFLAAIGTP
ncbi:aminotransferase class V-fold PLP-dependent enzyme [Variovorax sp. LjRoot130]|uniref:aminotransferase class V-fold PLP-dependent enzyme n=1 Tax=Variovorax sp. LjRoot130 TaxID=3342261 RepID=UPI003ECF792F